MLRRSSSRQEALDDALTSRDAHSRPERTSRQRTPKTCLAAVQASTRLSIGGLTACSKQSLGIVQAGVGSVQASLGAVSALPLAAVQAGVSALTGETMEMVKKEAADAKEAALMEELAAMREQLAAAREETETLKAQVPVIKSLDTKLRESRVARLSCAGALTTNVAAKEVEKGAKASKKALEEETSVLKPEPVVKVRPSTVSLECLARTRRLSESSLPALPTARSQATLRAAPSVKKNSTKGRLEDPSAAQPPAPTELGYDPFKHTCSSCRVLQAATTSSIDIPESSDAPSFMPVSCCTDHQKQESFYV